MKAELQDQGNSIVIDNFNFYPSELRNGNPYNTTFNIFVTSGSFRGFGDCEYNITEFKRLICELEEIYQFKRSTATLKDICYGSEITFTMNRLGSVKICGTVYADSMQHSLTFTFSTDQSVLLHFINDLKKLLEAES